MLKPRNFGGGSTPQVNADWLATSGVAQILNKPIAFAPTGHNQAWNTITSTPTTLGGYGITDGVTGAALASALSAKFNTPTGATNQYIRGDGSLATFPTIPTTKRIETYAGTTDANGLITVTYPAAFSTVPNVQPGPVPDSTMSWVLVSSTATGFSVRLVQRAVLTVLSLQVLAGLVTNVAGSAAQVLVVER